MMEDDAYPSPGMTRTTLVLGFLASSSTIHCLHQEDDTWFRAGMR
jgi:hypothetical protein